MVYNSFYTLLDLVSFLFFFFLRFFSSMFMRDIGLYFSFLVMIFSGFGISYWSHRMSWEVLPMLLSSARDCGKSVQSSFTWLVDITSEPI